MKNEYEGTHKIRQGLEQSALNLDSSIVTRLERARNQALEQQKTAVAELNLVLVNVLAPISGRISSSLLPNTRMLVAMAALTLGIVGTYYWNAFDQADENEEVDSALLADELPVDAYTDQGFEAWLEHSSSQSSVQ